jgi:hypothetical protein
MKYVSTCRVCNYSNVITHGSILAPFLSHRMFDIEPVKITKLVEPFINNSVHYVPCKTMGCQECGFLGLNIVFDDEEMGKLYSGYMQNEYLSTRRLYEPHFELSPRRPDDTKSAEEFILETIGKTPVKCLDYGCSDMSHSPFMNQSEVHGFDIGQDDTFIRSNTYNLVTCLHVLEHVPDLHDFLLKLKSIQSEFWYIEVPHEKHMQKYTALSDQVNNKEHWHEHINFFTLESLHLLLSKYFTVVNRVCTNRLIKFVLKHTS